MEFNNNQESNEKPYIDKLASALCKQIDAAKFHQKVAPVKDVLKLIGAGVFITASFSAPNLAKALKPFRAKENAYEVWKRFNIPYLKRTISRLEKQKLIRLYEQNGKQSITLTNQGKQKIARIALDELGVKKSSLWNGKWTLVSFDLPNTYTKERKILAEYLRAWGMYPLHKSVYLHGYPCEEQIEILRSFLGITEYVRLFTVTKIENDSVFKEFFGIN